MAQLGAIATASGAIPVPFQPVEPVQGLDGWPQCFAQNLIAAEGFLAEHGPAAVLIAGAGPISLAVALAASRRGSPLARVAAEPANADATRDAALIDHLADLLICFSEEDRAALRAESLLKVAVYCETPDQAGAAIRSLAGTPTTTTPL